MTSRSPTAVLRAAAAAVVLAAAGCQSDPPTYKTAGEVVYKDTGEPVTAPCVIWFESTAPPYQRSSGLVENGQFYTSTITDGSGSLQGEHRVRFHPGHPDGILTEEADKALGRIMHPKYLEFRTSGLVFTIQPNPDNQFRIEVERGPHGPKPNSKPSSKPMD